MAASEGYIHPVEGALIAYEAIAPKFTQARRALLSSYVLEEAVFKNCLSGYLDQTVAATVAVCDKLAQELEWDENQLANHTVWGGLRREQSRRRFLMEEVYGLHTRARLRRSGNFAGGPRDVTEKRRLTAEIDSLIRATHSPRLHS